MNYTGFLVNKVKFVVNRDSFLNHHNHIYLSRKDKQLVQAYEVDLKYKVKDIVKTLGEFFEREILINTNRLDFEYFAGVSMLDGKIIKIATDKIVSCGNFVDSSGMASHTLSNKLIETAFLEFIERQSFVLNYLSKSKGVKLRISNNKKISKYDKYIKNFVDSVDYYNVSIDEDINVILSIGVGKHKKAIGLGTHTSIENAIIKSQKEILQNFAVDCSKYDYEDIGFYYGENHEKDIYHKNFSSLSPQDLKKKYLYLSDSPYYTVKDDYKRTTLDIDEFVKKISYKYGMDPLIVAINSKRDVNCLKVAKVIDLNWFPHMKPDHYSNNIYKYVEQQTGLSLDRNIDIIPFP